MVHQHTTQPLHYLTQMIAQATIAWSKVAHATMLHRTTFMVHCINTLAYCCVALLSFTNLNKNK